MSDLSLLDEILGQILTGIERIERRFEGISSPDDFLIDAAGVDKLDGIAMMLIAIGESAKNFEKSGGKALMDKHLEIDWKGVNGIRDFLSHNYFDIDSEIVYAICENRIAELKETVEAMRRELDEDFE
ncbi:MAG: DUF86 domain-containing protein [Planctomycetes bacterium]|nr:DUF86 domain-containing protein [Planctomycetota bacterium]